MSDRGVKYRALKICFASPELPLISSAGRSVEESSTGPFCFPPSCLITPEKTTYRDGVPE